MDRVGIYYLKNIKQHSQQYFVYLGLFNAHLQLPYLPVPVLQSSQSPSSSLLFIPSNELEAAVNSGVSYSKKKKQTWRLILEDFNWKY